MMTLSSPHTAGKNTVSRLMLTLCAALIPGLIALTVLFSWGYLINVVLALVTALGVEALILTLRKRPVGFFLKDGSAAVTALLLACALPPLAPWWLTVLGTALAIIFGKHLFGGLGQNPFNPAMVAYALLLVSLPLLMTTRWAAVDNPADLSQTAAVIFQGGTEIVDGLTGATPLDDYKQNISRLTAEDVTTSAIYGDWGAVGWTPVNLAFLLGGLILLGLRVITWHIPASLLGSLALMSLLFGSDSDAFVPLTLHLLAGSTMLAAFFIATDPVSAATSNRGKLVYGAGIGILMYVIRTWGNYPDATAFAVLLMNFAAPLIDHYTRSRVYGHQSAVKGYKNEQD